MLDCETPLGREYMQHQYETQYRLERLGYVCINTPKASDRTDIFIARMRHGRLSMYGIAEIKSRSTAGGQPLTVDYLRANGGYLITAEKLTAGQHLSYKLGLPFYIIVNLIADSKLLVWKITDANGKTLDQIETRVTATRATVNGGIAERLNAFLSMDSKNLTIIE